MKTLLPETSTSLTLNLLLKDIMYLFNISCWGFFVSLNIISNLVSLVFVIIYEVFRREGLVINIQTLP